MLSTKALNCFLSIERNRWVDEFAIVAMMKYVKVVLLRISKVATNDANRKWIIRQGQPHQQTLVRHVQVDAVAV